LQDSPNFNYFVSQSAFMYPEQKDSSLATLQEIRTIMERSARMLSLSGWSGIWAGIVALAGAAVAYSWVRTADLTTGQQRGYEGDVYPNATQLIVLALCIFILALVGGYYFTYRKNKQLGIKIWNSASRKMLVSLMIPMVAGGILVLAFIFNGHWVYVAPCCLIFYGMALFNGSRYTISDIRYLGILEIILGCAGLLAPGWEWSLYLWAFGFGVLHILYGIIMWRKYDQQ
jgi:hypothetical protein